MTQLFIILIGALSIGIFLYNGRIREVAHKAAIQACKDKYVQNLDGYVALKKVYFDRDDQRRIRFLRRYQFEFATDGAQRYQGHIIMQGKWPVIVQMDAV